MILNYIENILFQKDNFPEIFSSYMFPGRNEETYSFQIKDSAYLYFLLNDSCSLISQINKCFGVNISFDLPASAVVVSFGYENRVVSFGEGILRISINHPYLEIDHFVIFSHIIVDNLLEKSFDFYSYVEKPLKQMTELQIKSIFKDYHYETHNVLNYDEVLEIIVNKKPMYKFLHNEINKPKRMYLRDAEHLDKYSLIIISIINDSLDLKEDEIIQNCVNGVMNHFFIREKEILEKYLQIGEFGTNYVIVEKYFDFEKKCKQELNSYFKDKLISSIRNYKQIKNDYVVLHNLISNDCNVLEIDDYMNIRLEEINNVLEAI